MRRSTGGEVGYKEDGLSVSTPLYIGSALELEDVQGRPDTRQIPIEQVGISDLRYPIVVLDRSAHSQRTTATASLSVGLPHYCKGTHMSRFIEILERHRGEITVRTLPKILKDLRTTLDAETAKIQVSFPYFLERTAPESGASALMDYECSFDASMADSDIDFVLGVAVPVTSLCPCSKVISNYGAHNQRGYIRIRIRSSEIVWIEELIEVAERSASAPVFPLLKRADERYLTMLAYENPVFVEDMVRNVAVQLRQDRRIQWFQIRAENHESIHNHTAYAQVSFGDSAC